MKPAANWLPDRDVQPGAPHSNDTSDRHSRLSIHFVTLSELYAASACELLTHYVWKRDWSEDLAQSYFAWRYTGRANGDTLLALDRGRCIGIIDSFLRPYWIDGCRQLVRETCDWFCLPAYRPLGVGLHLLRRIMDKPEPIIAIGGTEYTQELLPKLRWASVRGIHNFVLPASAKTAAAFLARGAGRRIAWAAGLVPNVPLARHPRSALPFGKLLMKVRDAGDNGRFDGIGPYALGPEIEPPVLDWLACAPPLLGQFVVLSFLADDVQAGIAICRIEKLSVGCVAQIVHLQPASLEVIDWMVSETVTHLLERGAGVIFCRSSCQTVSSALTATGFYRRKPVPMFWWARNSLPPAGRFNLASLQADDALHFR
jgi:hypothetical protein